MFCVFTLQIVNPSPLPGLMLSPVYGVVPVGGVTLISATLTPNAIMKFDTQVNIAVRNGKPVELRVSGTVEPPLVDIDLVLVDLISTVSSLTLCLLLLVVGMLDCVVSVSYTHLTLPTNREV